MVRGLSADLVACIHMFQNLYCHGQERERLKDEERRYGAQILSEQIEERKIQRLLQEEQVEQVTSPMQTGPVYLDFVKSSRKPRPSNLSDHCPEWRAGQKETDNFLT